MREHVRGSGRYHRTEQGAITLDWGGNGADYKVLDFTYVVQGKLGNMRKLYGRIRRNADGETYDTYDVMAGNDRLKTTGAFTIETAIKSFVHAMTGVMPTIKRPIKDMMPLLPDSAKEPMGKVLKGAMDKMRFCFRGRLADLEGCMKDSFIDIFALENWQNAKFFVDSVKEDVIPVGIVNVAVGKYSNLHREFRDWCDMFANESESSGDESGSGGERN